MITNFPRYDLRRILQLLDETEDAYREQANNLDDIQKLYQLAAARGVSAAKAKIKEYLKTKYNILKL